MANKLNTTIRAINRLYFGFRTQANDDIDASGPNHNDKYPTPVIVQSITSLLDRTWLMCRHLTGDAAVGSGESGDFLYCHVEEGTMDAGTTKGWVPLVADRLALPGPREGAVVDFLDFLPQPLRELYSAPSGRILRSPPPAQHEVRALKASVKGSSTEYAKVLLRLDESGMLDWLEEPPMCYNGLFAVNKDSNHDRLIIDARPANLYFHEPPALLHRLATPSDFADIIVPPGLSLYVGKADVKNMFHRFRLPQWMVPYFGLPPINGRLLGYLNDGLRYPALRSLGMGFSHAVAIAQSVHYKILEESLADCRNLSVSQAHTPLKKGWFEYIDDHGVMSVSLHEAEKLTSTSIDALDRAGLPANKMKTQRPTASSSETSCLGLTLRKDGWLLPASRQLRLLIEDTQRFIKERSADKVRLRSLLGRWMWPLLLFRPALSVLSGSTGRMMIEGNPSEGRIAEDWEQVYIELEILVAMVPCLAVDLTTPQSPLAIATDASLMGGGVVTKAVSGEERSFLSGHRERKGWYSRHTIATETLDADRPAEPGPSHPPEAVIAILRSTWKTQISLNWSFQESCITILEAQALILGIRHLLESEENHGTRPIIFLDSRALLGAVAKGRSSSDRLNHLCRRIAALTAAGSIRPSWLWTPSSLNPADTPSRAHYVY